MLTIDSSKKDDFFPPKKYFGDMAGKNIFFTDFRVIDAIIVTRTEKNLDYLIFRQFTEEIVKVLERDENKTKGEMERLDTTKALAFVVSIDKKKELEIFFDINHEKIIKPWFFRKPMYKLFENGDSIVALMEDNITKPSPLKTCGIFFSKDNCIPILGDFYYFTQWLLPPTRDLIAKDYGTKTALQLFTTGLPVKVEINSYSNYNLLTDAKALFDLPGELIQDFESAITEVETKERSSNKSIILPPAITQLKEEKDEEEEKQVDDDIKQLFFPELSGKETIPLSYFAKCKNKKQFMEAIFKLHPNGIYVDIDLTEFIADFKTCELKPSGYLIFKALPESRVFEKGTDGNWKTNAFKDMIIDVIEYDLIAISRYIPSRNRYPKTQE